MHNRVDADGKEESKKGNDFTSIKSKAILLTRKTDANCKHCVVKKQFAFYSSLIANKLPSYEFCFRIALIQNTLSIAVNLICY